MRARVLGPCRGYYAAVSATGLNGNPAAGFTGLARVFTQWPQSFDAPGALAIVQSPQVHATVEQALVDAEDRAVHAIDGLPERTAEPAPHAPLCSLMYTSRAARPLTKPDLDRLLAAARRRNAALGISGVLLYFDGAFMQYIEGPEPHLMLVYRIIRQDPLHAGLVKIRQQPIATRVFEDWSMAFDAPGASDWLYDYARPALLSTRPARAVECMLAAFMQRDTLEDALLRGEPAIP